MRAAYDALLMASQKALPAVFVGLRKLIYILLRDGLEIAFVHIRSTWSLVRASVSDVMLFTSY